MTKTDPKAEPAANEKISVSVEPAGPNAGVYVVSVRVDNHAPGSSVVRTSPRQFAFPNQGSGKP